MNSVIRLTGAKTRFALTGHCDHSQLRLVTTCSLSCGIPASRRGVWTDAPQEGASGSTFYDSTVEQVQPTT